MLNFYNQTVKETLEKFHTNPDIGLTPHEVENRRKKYGQNVLDLKGRSLISKILEPFLDVLMFILVIALAISLFKQEFVDAILIAIIMAINAIIFYVQQFSTERILRSLKNSIVQTVNVLRGGEEVSLDSSELVPGDIVLLSEGVRIPADGRLLEESGLLANESMLTGESEPVAKDADKLEGTKKVYEQTNMVFSGSFIITGTGRMIVTATGNNTQYGHIASLASSAQSTSPIQEKINKLIAKVAITVVSLAAIVFIIQLIRDIPLLDALSFTLAMTVSAVPESLPVAISVVLALGARRMAKKKALIRDMRAIESIGIVTTIASDKTGTLTENKLSLQDTWSPSNDNEELLKYIAESALSTGSSTDPLDSAIFHYLETHHPHLTDIGPYHSYAFDQDLKLSGNLYKTKSGTLRLVVKGAPETILDRCKVPENKRISAEAEIIRMSEKGYKVIALATANLDREINELALLTPEDKFTFKGIIAIADALRPESIPAVTAAKRAGVSIRMITGDHVKTATAIGRELGIVTDESQVLDCSCLASVSDTDLDEMVRHVTVFARVTPEDKYKILSTLKKAEITAMTGDGVNDVPALTNAHIGIAMGDGPPIVQDAGDIVLLDNNFKNIIEAMREGRIILTNIRRMLAYLLSTNAGEVIIMLCGLIFGGVHVLFPIQILWVNLVTHSIMVVPVGLEPPEKHYLCVKPEPKNAPILNWTLISRMILIAIIMATVVVSVYFIALSMFSSAEANTLAFTALVVMQWANAFNMRATHEPLLTRLKVAHKPFYFALAVAILLQILALFGPLSTFVRTVPISIPALVIVAIIAFILPIIGVELHKKYISAKNTTKKS
jgi:Ca2+-transporting ATPase